MIEEGSCNFAFEGVRPGQGIGVFAVLATELNRAFLSAFHRLIIVRFFQEQSEGEQAQLQVTNVNLLKARFCFSKEVR